MTSNDPVIEKYITLTDNRTLAYTTSGDPASPSLVIFFHGLFGIGRTSDKDLCKTLKARGFHFAAPTLPGWGKSSPRPKDIPYHITLARDTTALIAHLYPSGLPVGFRLYINGGSYGTVPAQMLYGAPFDIFPYGKYIVGCLLLAPFSPFKYHEGYAKTLNALNYVAVGPPTRCVPFNLVPRLVAFLMAKKLANEVSAEKFVREVIFDKMGEQEKKDFAEWRKRYGKEEGEFEKQFAVNIVKSVRQTTDGFIETSDVIHSDWGFNPAELDDERNKRPIYLCASTGDDLASDGMSLWLSQTYKNAHWESVEGGGHIAGFLRLEEVWGRFLKLTDQVAIDY